MIRKFFVLISSFFIVFFTVSSVYVKADSASLVVKLGSLASGGLSESAFLGTFGPVAGVLAAYALQANGINTHISEASAEQGITKTEYIYKTLSNWSDITNRDALDVVQSLVNNVTYGSGGTLYFAQDALNIISQFGNWIVSNNEIFSFELPSIQSETVLNIDNFSFPMVSSGDIFYSTGSSSSGNKVVVSINNVSGSSVFALSMYSGLSSSGTSLYFFSPNSFTINYVSSGAYVTTARNISSSKASNSPFYYSTSGATARSFGNFEGIPYISGYSGTSGLENFLKSLGSEYEIITSGGDIPDQFYGDKWADNVSGLSLPEGYTGAIDTGVIQGLQDQIQGVGDYVIGLQDYIHALEDAINGREADVPIEDTDTSIPFPIPVPQEVTPVYTPVAPESYPADDEVEDIVNPEITAPSTDIINGLQFDLTQVFPFCIPFDIYALLQKFVADPVAPQVHIDWDIPFVDSNFVLDIDFSAYNSVAAVLRTMELIGAIVGLAIATRAIYLRS